MIFDSCDNNVISDYNSFPNDCTDSDGSDFLHKLRTRKLNNIIVAHLNINSLSKKIDSLNTMINGNIDILVLSESKLNESHTNAQLSLVGFNEPFRRDRINEDGGGGVVIYVRSDIPSRELKKHTSSDDFEGIFIELNFRKNKWLLFGGYRAPRQNKDIFFENLSKGLEFYIQSYDRIMIIGDFNLDVKDSTINSFMSIFNLKSLIKEPTCFKSIDNPSCIDLILTNTPNSFILSNTVTTGISDFHKMVISVFKTTFAKAKPKELVYRAYKKFDKEKFRSDVLEMLNNAATPISYTYFKDCIIDKLNEYAPLKKRVVRSNEVPYMTKKLRKAISNRSRLKNRYYKLKTNESFLKFKKQRNYCSRLYKKERKIFYENIDVSDYKSSRKFWALNKPFFSDKGNFSNNIILIENDEIINDPTDVANVLNDFFKNAVHKLNIATPIEHITDTDDLVDPIEIAIQKYKNHPSIKKISEIVQDKNRTSSFSFNPTSVTEIEHIVKKLNPRKSGTYNDIPCFILKEFSGDLCKFITDIINDCISNSDFPKDMKKADITPVFKDTDRTLKSKYRPVSLLPIISKLFERVMSNQITVFIEAFLSQYLCGYRKGYSTQHALTLLVEKWKKALDNRGYAGAVLMDLSKAFETLDFELLIAKLHAYGFDDKSLKLIFSYLTDRWQRTKVDNKFSSWSELLQGVPQGSILGPLLFNIYLNDLFYFINDTDVCNYADDTSLYAVDFYLNNLVNRLEKETDVCAKWYYWNYMALNGGKCHFLIGGAKDEIFTIQINGNTVTETEIERLLGIKIDNRLKFDSHVKMICKIAGQKINALCRQCKILPFNKRKLLVNSYFESIFEYGKLLWMFVSRKMNNKINQLHCRALRIVYRNYDLNFNELLYLDGSCTIHHRCIKSLAIELYKCKNELSPKIMNNVFRSKADCNRQTRNNNFFYCFNNPKTDLYGIRSLSYFGPIVWNMLPNSAKDANSLSIFKNQISSWKIDNCECRLCKSYIKSFGFV